MLPRVIDPLDTVELQNELVRRQRRERRRREVELSELRRLLGSELGRSFVMRLIEDSGLFEETFDPSQPECSHLAAKHDGKQSVGRRLFRMIADNCFELWTVMLRERSDRLQRERQEDEEQ